MKSGTTIGRKGTAKRRIMIREYFSNTYFKKTKKSDPFESEDSEVDDSEWDIDPFELQTTKEYKLFAKDENNSDKEASDDNQIKDDILSTTPNLAEADKFIASIKLTNNNRKTYKENFVLPNTLDTHLDMKMPETLELFKKESQKLDKLRLQEINGNSSDDDLLI